MVSYSCKTDFTANTQWTIFIPCSYIGSVENKTEDNKQTKKKPKEDKLKTKQKIKYR